MLLTIVLAALHCRRRGLSAEPTLLLPMGLFLVLTPGFGLQYLAGPAAMVSAAGLLGGASIAIVGGTLCVAAYGAFWDGTLPAYSGYVTVWNSPLRFAGLAVWVVMIVACVWALRRGKV
jgi:hypothetical protein